MAGYELKTKITDAKVGTFIEAVQDERQRADAYKIIELMQRLTGHEPKMWGPSIVGFGQYHYKYASGHEGDMCRIGFSPRKGNTVLYITDGYDKYADLMARLGKHRTGKSCLYVKKLSDIDEEVLEQLCIASLDWMAQKYPE
jgi:hypothetical protein